jgi:hypothetical protein
MERNECLGAATDSFRSREGSEAVGVDTLIFEDTGL